jgi:hypothetical protein
VYLAYVDESGDSGARGSLTFALSCVLIEDRQWSTPFDLLLEYRRLLKRRYGLPIRAEVKANFILGSRGPFSLLGLTEAARFKIYKRFLTIQAELHIKTFAVLIRKDRLPRPTDPRERAWAFLLQRLERFTFEAKTQVLILHDEGEEKSIRKYSRKARRFGNAGSRFGTGSLSRPFLSLIDDPVPRLSHQSYFIQLADLNAYAAFRRYYPPPARLVQIVPRRMWEFLATARLAEVNRLTGGPPGIVAWPRNKPPQPKSKGCNYRPTPNIRFGSVCVSTSIIFA